MGAKVKERRLSNPAYIGVLLFVGVILVGGVIMYGKSDNGEIDVNNAINTSNQKRIDEGGSPNDNVGTTPNALKDLPNGGLVPQDPTNKPPVPEPVVEEEDATDETTDNPEDNPEGGSSEEKETVPADEEVPADESVSEETPSA